jgi:hypothetical protein
VTRSTIRSPTSVFDGEHFSAPARVSTSVVKVHIIMDFLRVVVIPEAFIEAVGNTKAYDCNCVSDAAYKQEDEDDDERDCPTGQSPIIGIRIGN